MNGQLSSPCSLHQQQGNSLQHAPVRHLAYLAVIIIALASSPCLFLAPLNFPERQQCIGKTCEMLLSMML
jgi:hypothetical protein